MSAYRSAVRLARTALRVAVGSALLTCLILPLSPRPAAACDVSIDYKPSLTISLRHGLGHTEPCTTGTSVAGSVVVALLALGAVAAAANAARKRGAARAEGADLTAYLRATGVAGPGDGAEGTER